MQVDRVGAPLSAGRAVKPGQGPRAGGAGFDAALHGAAPDEACDAASDVIAPTPAGQAAYDVAYQAEVADREARRHGRAMLQALAVLQVAVLDGAPADARGALMALAGRKAQAHDPVLRLILREIGVRAAVELGRAAIISNVSIA